MDPYTGLSRTEKCNAIRTKYRIDEPPGYKCEGVEITMSPELIHGLLDALKDTSKQKLETDYSAASNLRLIDENWGVDLARFPLPYHSRDFRPDGEASTWDLRLLATLAILSEFTPGQGEYMGTQLNTAVELRNIDGRLKKKAWVVTEVDVKRVIKDLLHLLKDEADEKEDMVKKRKAEYDARCKSHNKARKYIEQAIDADLPVGDQMVDRVGRTLKKTTFPDIMDNTSSDDEISPPSRRMTLS